MAENPLISVIIPIYNAENYLFTTLNSVANQTYNNFEVIMINDGSNDNSEEIAEKFVQKDKRFKLYSQQNSGGSKSRNKGLELANGEYIAFLDNDDIYAPDYLEVLADNMQKNNAEVSCCSYLKFYGDGDYHFERSNENDKEIFVSESPFADKFIKKKKIEMLMWCKLYKRSLFDEIRFCEELPAINDMLLNIEILLKAEKLVYCRQKLIAYRILQNSQTNKRLSDKRIEEYAILPHMIVKLGSKYPKYEKYLRKVAVNYAFGQCIKEIKEKYNAEKDRDIYEKMRVVIKKLQEDGIFTIFSLGLMRWIKTFLFMRF